MSPGCGRRSIQRRGGNLDSDARVVCESSEQKPGMTNTRRGLRVHAPVSVGSVAAGRKTTALCSAEDSPVHVSLKELPDLSVM